VGAIRGPAPSRVGRPLKIAITGGTGFVGRHLARRLAADGHQVVLIARGVDTRDASIRTPGLRFFAANITDARQLAEALAGCQAVAHYCAGINREIGDQTFARVHLEGTRALVTAAQRAGAGKFVLLSFLRARPNCGSTYHESKWAAEELVRASGLDYAVIKAAMIYGPGDHMLDHLSHALYTFPVFPLIGRDPPVRPVAVEDIVKVLRAALAEGGFLGQRWRSWDPRPCALAKWCGGWLRPPDGDRSWAGCRSECTWPWPLSSSM